MEVVLKRSNESKRTRWMWAGILLLMVLATLPFWLTSFDTTAAHWFYSSNISQHWPIGQQTWARWLYLSGTYLPYVAMILTALTWLLPKKWLSANWQQAIRVWMLALIIGPGLLINGISKPMTERARPRQVTMFQGACPYAEPFVFGECEEGRAFPCGHCSVAFSVAAIGLAFWHSRPALALGFFVLSIIYGLGMGGARMAAGGHFVSDIAWSALMTWLSCLFAAWLLVWRKRSHESVLKDETVLRNPDI